MELNNLLEKALFYASKGLYVFPCREKYEGKYFSNKYKTMVDADPKQPRISGGLKSSSNKEEVIISWWSKRGWENSAIGVNCGMSKLFTIDIDMHSGNGFEKFMELGIADNGAYHTITANGGIHITYHDPNGIGKTRTREKLSIDTRGIGGYIIMPPSYILDKKTNDKKYYKLVEKEWDDFPVEITQEIIDKINAFFDLNKENKSFNKKKYVSTKNDFKRVEKAVNDLPKDFLDNYQDWVNVGMSLRELGDDGFKIWSNWTEKYFMEKPESKRVGTLEYKWKSFFENSNNSKIGLGSLFYWVKDFNERK